MKPKPTDILASASSLVARSMRVPPQHTQLFVEETTEFNLTGIHEQTFDSGIK